MMIKSDLIEAKVTIRIKNSRESSIGAKKPPIRDVSSEKQRLSTNNYFSQYAENTGDEKIAKLAKSAELDAGNLRQKLRDLEDVVFDKDKLIKDLKFENNDNKLRVEELQEKNQELERNLKRKDERIEMLEARTTTDQSQEKYLDRVREIIKQRRPEIMDVVEIGLKEEKKRLQDKYNQMMENLLEKERSLGGSLEAREERGSGKPVFSVNTDIRNYITKLESGLKEKDLVIAQRNTEIIKLKDLCSKYSLGATETSKVTNMFKSELESEKMRGLKKSLAYDRCEGQQVQVEAQLSKLQNDNKLLEVLYCNALEGYRRERQKTQRPVFRVATSQGNCKQLNAELRSVVEEIYFGGFRKQSEHKIRDLHKERFEGDRAGFGGRLRRVEHHAADRHQERVRQAQGDDGHQTGVQSRRRGEFREGAVRRAGEGEKQERGAGEGK
jgi:hypothetical protein